MKRSLNEIILTNLLTERRYAIESDNKERQAELEVAIREQEKMMIDDALKDRK